MRNRSIIYIDGFNLYYGAVKDARGKRWPTTDIGVDNGVVLQ